MAPPPLARATLLELVKLASPGFGKWAATAVAPVSPEKPAVREPPTRSARINFAVLFAIAVALAGYVAWPFRAPIFLALVLASVLHGVHAWLTRRLRGHRTLAALATTLGLVTLLVGPFGALLAFVGGQLVVGLAFVRDQLGISTVDQLKTGTLSPHGEKLINRALLVLHLSRDQVDGMIRNAATAAEHSLQAVLRGSSDFVFHTAIMVIAFYFFLLEGERLTGWLKSVSPLAERQTRDLIEEFRSVSRASILGAVLIALVQGVAATIGFLITGAPHAVFFGLVTLFASFIPVVGTLLVGVPAVALLWMSGHHGGAIVLGLWWVVFVIGMEQVGKPLVLRAILRGGEEMHTGLVFLSLLGGIEMFGLIGIVLGPLAITFFLAMVRIYQRDFRGGGSNLSTTNVSSAKLAIDHGAEGTPVAAAP